MPEPVIMSAIREHNLNSVKMELKSNPRCLSVIWNGLKPIHEACKDGYLEITQVLLNAGASLTEGDKFGQTPLHWAATSGNVQLINYLIQHGADVNARTNDGSTPLFSSRSKIESMRTLLNAGADINATDNEGYTPWIIGGFGKDSRAIEELLKCRGADIKVRMPRGKPARIVDVLPESQASLDVKMKYIVKWFNEAGMTDWLIYSAIADPLKKDADGFHRKKYSYDHTVDFCGYLVSLNYSENTDFGPWELEVSRKDGSKTTDYDMVGFLLAILGDTPASCYVDNGSDYCQEASFTTSKFPDHLQSYIEKLIADPNLFTTYSSR